MIGLSIDHSTFFFFSKHETQNTISYSMCIKMRLYKNIRPVFLWFIEMKIQKSLIHQKNHFTLEPRLHLHFVTNIIIHSEDFWIGVEGTHRLYIFILLKKKKKRILAVYESQVCSIARARYHLKTYVTHPFYWALFMFCSCCHILTHMPSNNTLEFWFWIIAHRERERWKSFLES